MTTIDSIYQEMQRIAPLALAESWDNPGLLVDCGGEVSRVLVTLDITPEVVEEAARKGCGLIVSHHPVIFSPLKKLSGQDVAFQLVKSGISAICMHTNLDAAEGGVNEVLAGIFGMREMEAFAEGCGRVGSIEPITVPELAKRAQKELASRCNQPFNGPAVQIKFADTGKTVRRLAVISGAGGSLFEDAIARGADCLLTGEANHHHAIDAKRLGLSLIAAGHYATEFPVTAAVAEKLRREEKGGILGNVLAGNPDVAASVARTVLGTMSQEQKDQLLVQLVTKNREKLLDKGNRAARSRGIGVQLCDVAVRKL